MLCQTANSLVGGRQLDIRCLFYSPSIIWLQTLSQGEIIFFLIIRKMFWTLRSKTPLYMQMTYVSFECQDKWTFRFVFE